MTIKTKSNIKYASPQVRQFDDISDLSGLTGKYDGEQISVKGYHPGTSVGGDGFFWDSDRPKSEHNGGTVISPTVTWDGTLGTLADFLNGVGETDPGGSGCWVRESGASISTADFGSVGSGDETNILEAACLAAPKLQINIPHASFTVTGGSVAGADCNGCSVVGVGTVLTGNLQNTRSIYGLVIGGENIDRRAVHPAVSFDSSPKLLYRLDTNNYYLYVQKPTTGYNIIQLNNNVTTPGPDSLATTSSDPTMWRVNGVLDAVDVKVVHQVATASNGTFTQIDLNIGIPTHTSGRDIQYERSTTTGAWYEMTLDVPLDGALTVSFVRSSTASTDVTITVDGSAIDSNFDTSATTAYVDTRVYKVEPGTRVVRITNNDPGSAALQIVGLNYSSLREARPDMSYDTSGHYRNSAFVDPLVSNSANDYAIFDIDASDVGAPDGIWGGSYHGGETGISSTFYIDGIAASLSNGDSSVGIDVRVTQSCTVDWSAKGGGSLDVESELAGILGGYVLQMSQIGDMNAGRGFFTTLFGVNEAFTELSVPEIISDLTALPNAVLYPLGKTSKVVYKEGAQRISIEHTIYGQEENNYGGSTIWPVSGSYNKYYYSPVYAGKRNITKSSAINIFKAY